jgi:hypothetical protein
METCLILSDDLPHELSWQLRTAGERRCRAHDDIGIINPAGDVVDILGYFIPMDDDTAWYNRAYGELFGQQEGLGVNKPLVRGETGIDFPNQQDWNRDLLLDAQGIWLHNNLWGQVNSSGMYDLFWWASETIPETLYNN